MHDKYTTYSYANNMGYSVIRTAISNESQI